MPSIARVLFPTDFSPNAQRALPLACEMTSRSAAELHILHSVGFLPHLPDEPESLSPGMETLFEELATRSRQRFLELRESLPDGLSAVWAVERGFSPAEVILEYALDTNIDLIVMGTHGGRGIRKLILGSVAEEVVRLSPTSVITVPPGDGADVGRVRTIVVPVDFTERSRAAVRAALELRALFDAKLHLLHVVHPPAMPDFYGVTLAIEPDTEGPGSLREQALEAMRKLLESEGGAGAAARVHARAGQPAGQIIEFASEVAADLIILPSHGRAGTPDVLIGSVTARVLRRARCAVLTLKVHAGAPDAASAEAGAAAGTVAAAARE